MLWGCLSQHVRRTSVALRPAAWGLVRSTARSRSPFDNCAREGDACAPLPATACTRDAGLAMTHEFSWLPGLRGHRDARVVLAPSGMLYGSCGWCGSSSGANRRTASSHATKTCVHTPVQLYTLVMQLRASVHVPCIPCMAPGLPGTIRAAAPADVLGRRGPCLQPLCDRQLLM
jgi:hypothetical protein